MAAAARKAPPKRKPVIKSTSLYVRLFTGLFETFYSFVNKVPLSQFQRDRLLRLGGRSRRGIMETDKGPRNVIFMGMGFLFVFFGFNTAQNFVVPLFGSVGSLCTCRPDGFSRPDLT